MSGSALCVHVCCLPVLQDYYTFSTPGNYTCIYIGAMNMDLHETASTKSLFCADKYSTLEILYIQSKYIHVHVCVHTKAWE